MIPSVLSRLVILLFGILYPSYSSYKAVRTKNVKEYVRWMMYWIVFGLFTCAETFTDIFLSFWFPFYYEMKIILVVYLLSPATNGSSILYRKFVHPLLTRKEQEIDECIAKAMERGYHTMLDLGSKSVAYATSVIMQTAIRGGGGLVNQIRKSYSLDDVNSRGARTRIREISDEVDDGVDEDRQKYRRRKNQSPRRMVSSGSQVDLYFPEVESYKRSSIPIDQDILSYIRSSETISSGYSSTEPLYPGAEHGSEDHLLRTSSIGAAKRTRTRLARKPASEEGSGCSTTEPGESQFETDYFHPYPIPAPVPGNFVVPFIRPEYRYLFANLTQQQICAFIASANPTPIVSEIQPEPRVEPQPEPVKVSVASPSAVLRSIMTEDAGKQSSGVVEVTDVEEAKSRSGKYNKRPAPVPPSGTEAEEDAKKDADEFCTPDSSPVLARKKSDGQLNEAKDETAVAEEKPVPEEVKTEPPRVEEARKEVETKDQTEKKTKTKTKGKDGSHLSKMLHLSKIQFPFWSQKPGKHPAEEAGMPRNDSRVSLESRESFISLKGGETEEAAAADSTKVEPETQHVDVREMSQSPSSKRRPFTLD